MLKRGDKIIGGGYRKKKYSNPFFRKKRKKINLSYFSWRLKLIVVEIMVLICGFVWFFCFSPYFNIEMISAAGAEKISGREIEDLAWRQTERRRLLLGSQKNLFLFDLDELIKTLNERYCFDDLKVEKKRPDKIIITLKEKTYSAIWRESSTDKYYYIDLEGNIIDETNPLEIKNKNYPLIDNKRENAIADRKIEKQNDNIDYIVRLFDKFKKENPGFAIERFIIDNEINTIKMSINQGTEIYFNTKEDMDKQISKLMVIITEKLKDDLNNKKYIDLRYGERVYYQ